MFCRLFQVRWGHGVKVGLRLSICWLLVTSPLDLLSLHAHAEVRSAPEEEFVVVGSGIRTLGDAAKAIEV